MNIQKFLVPFNSDSTSETEILDVSLVTSDQELLVQKCLSPLCQSDTNTTSDTNTASTSQSQNFINNSEDNYQQKMAVKDLNVIDGKSSTIVDGNVSQKFDVLDIGTWPNVFNNNTRDLILTNGPTQIYLPFFPKDEGRHFSDTHYFKQLLNNETILRRWLAYSVSQNGVLCFYCRLFDKKSSSNLVCGGYKKWKKLLMP